MIQLKQKITNRLNNNKTINLKNTLDRIFDKDLDLSNDQRYKLIKIIGDHSRHEFNAGFQAAKKII